MLNPEISQLLTTCAKQLDRHTKLAHKKPGPKTERAKDMAWLHLNELVDFAGLVLAAENGRIALELSEKAKKPASELRSIRSKLKTLNRQAERGAVKLQAALNDAQAIEKGDPDAKAFAEMKDKLAPPPRANAPTSKVEMARSPGKRSSSAAKSSAPSRKPASGTPKKKPAK